MHMKLQPYNGIIIREFLGDADDKALYTLIPFLKAAVSVIYFRELNTLKF